MTATPFEPAATRKRLGPISRDISRVARHPPIVRARPTVVSTVLNAAFMNGPCTLPIVSGALVVVVSVFNYNDNGDS